MEQTGIGVNQEWCVLHLTKAAFASVSNSVLAHWILDSDYVIDVLIKGLVGKL